MAGTYAKYSGLGPAGGGGSGVSSINGETGAISITAGTGIAITTPTGSTIQIDNTGALDAFTIVQTDTGTFPTATTATSTLTLHNTDGHISIAGNSGTNTVTLNTTGLQPTGNYITALTGDVTATGPGSVAATLATVNGSPGTFTYATVTVNAKGLVTAASSGAAPTGTVTSVAFSDGSTTPIYTITGSPVTTSGTLTETLKTQSANTVFAGPTSGAAAQPTFRALVNADLPSITVVNKSANYTVLSTDNNTYFTLDTSGAGFSLTLPTPVSGFRIKFTDSTGSFSTNNLTLVPPGAAKISGLNANKVFSTNWGGWEAFSNGTDYFII